MIVKAVRKLTSRNWLNLFEAKYEHVLPKKEGEKKARVIKGRWLFSSRKQKPQYLDYNRPDAVTIVPLTDEPEPRVILVTEFRVPINCYQIAFPAGLLEKDEAVAECAKRELPEETGYEITQVTGVSPAVYSSPGMTDESTAFVFCKCKLAPEGAMQHGDAEDITVLALNKQEVGVLLEQVRAGHRRMSAKCWLLLRMYNTHGSFDGI